MQIHPDRSSQWMVEFHKQLVRGKHVILYGNVADQFLLNDRYLSLQRFLSVYQAYSAAKDVTLRRLYIDTMQEILARTPSIVLDDKLQGIVPYLPLGNLPNAPPPGPEQAPPHRPRRAHQFGGQPRTVNVPLTNRMA